MTHHESPPAPHARDPETRRRDHDEIDHLADNLLPDLIDRLASSGLGELEIREDDWRIRLRRPVSAPGDGRDRDPEHDPDRSADRPSRLRDGRDPQPGRIAAGTDSGPSAGPGLAGGPGRSHRVIATSPAVGVFQPRAEIRSGTRVRAGDRLAVVDLLGLPQDVVAPEDGVVQDTLVEAGQGVEYGQDLIVIEPARGRVGAEGAPAATTVTGS